MKTIQRTIFSIAFPFMLSFFLFSCGGGDESSKGNSQAFDKSSQQQQGRRGGQARQGGGPRGGGQGAGSRGAGPNDPRSLKGEANVDVSDEELKTFVEVSLEVLPMQKKMRNDQRKAIEESSMSMRRFRQIMKAMKSRRGKPKLTQKEKKEVKEIRKQQQEGMKELRKKTKEVVKKKEGIDWDRFNKIAGALNKDRQLKKRFDQLHKKMRKEQGMGADSAVGAP